MAVNPTISSGATLLLLEGLVEYRMANTITVANINRKRR
jgi:hypothetical protein